MRVSTVGWAARLGSSRHVLKLTYIQWPEHVLKLPRTQSPEHVLERFHSRHKRVIRRRGFSTLYFSKSVNYLPTEKCYKLSLTNVISKWLITAWKGNTPSINYEKPCYALHPSRTLMRHLIYADDLSRSCNCLLSDELPNFFKLPTEASYGSTIPGRKPVMNMSTVRSVKTRQFRQTHCLTSVLSRRWVLHLDHTPDLSMSWNCLQSDQIRLVDYIGCTALLFLFDARKCVYTSMESIKIRVF